MATTTRKTTTQTKAKTATTTVNTATVASTAKVSEDVNSNVDINVADTVSVNTATANTTPVEVHEKPKKVFTDSDYILCRSVWSGGLNIVAQSGNLYEFKDYGSECEINYRDLVTLIRRGSDHVFLPRFVILDEDFLSDYPTVQRVYGSMYTKRDLEDILDLPITQMKAEIEKLPDSTRDNMRNLIATQIANGRLDSIAKVRVLTEMFNSDFNLLSDLFIK